MLDRIINFVNNHRNRNFVKAVIYSRDDDTIKINATRTSEEFITDENMKVNAMEFLLNGNDLKINNVLIKPAPGDRITDELGVWELVSLNGEDYRDPLNSGIMLRVFCVKVDDLEEPTTSEPTTTEDPEE